MIGCGSFARQFHGPAQVRCAQEAGAIERLACCDTSAERAREYAGSFGFARSYADAGEMLERERPDAVILAVPPTATAAAGAAVLERGLPLLLEKPPGTTASELARLREAAARGAARAQVGFNRRHMPVVREALSRLRGEFGGTSPLAISYEMARHGRWDEDFTTTAIHAVDAACVLAGTAFRAVELRFTPHADGERRAADVVMEFACANGTTVRVDVRPVAGVNAETAVIHGRAQTLRLAIPFPSGPFAVSWLEHWRANALVAAYADEALDPLERMGIYDETRAFLAAVRTGEPMNPGLADCVQQVAVMELLRAGQSGRFALAEA
jgi:predicted dehydrogenase